VPFELTVAELGAGIVKLKEKDVLEIYIEASPMRVLNY
jgi:hypothetical protein